jgi:hypothetical protein
MTDVESFERAFVAVSYLLGRREGILDGITGATDSARRSARIALSPSREDRAKRLAAELFPIVASLEARRLR